jgi:hypothetical protein
MSCGDWGMSSLLIGLQYVVHLHCQHVLYVLYNEYTGIQVAGRDQVTSIQGVIANMLGKPGKMTTDQKNVLRGFQEGKQGQKIQKDDIRNPRKRQKMY